MVMAFNARGRMQAGNIPTFRFCVMLSEDF